MKSQPQTFLICSLSINIAGALLSLTLSLWDNGSYTDISKAQTDRQTDTSFNLDTTIFLFFSFFQAEERFETTPWLR